MDFGVFRSFKLLESALLDTVHIKLISKNLQIRRFKSFENLSIIEYFIVSGTRN